MYRAIGKALFPDLTYANESGGDPNFIPDLTWEQLKQFHATHYHPSNAYFFTYGNLPLDEILTFIEEKALSRFERIKPDVSIPEQAPFQEPRVFEFNYPLSKDEDAAKKSQCLVAWPTVHVGNSFDVLSFRVLREILLGNPASPLQKALITSGLGDALADNTGFQDSYRDAVFAAGLKGINTEDAEKVEQIVLETLNTLVEEGIDEAMVEAAIHQLEIEQREVSNQGFPFSLKVFFTLSGAYVYGGDPYKSLQFDEDVAQLQDERKKGRYFENLIKTKLLDNPHRARIVLAPDQELEDRERSAELAKLAEIEAGLSDDRKQQIVELGVQLKELQEAKQDTSLLPTLELSDVPMDLEDVQHSIQDVAGARVGIFPQPTNGLTYIDVRFDFSSLDDALKDYLPLFAFAVPKMGAGGDDYLKMAARIDTYTGGISMGASVRPISGGDDFRQSITLTGKSLVRNHEPFLAIVKDLLTSVSFDPKRLKEVLSQFRAQQEMYVTYAGMMYAAALAASKLSAVSALDERLGGLTQLKLLKELSKLEEGELGNLISQLEAIRDQLFSNRGLNVCITTEDASVNEVTELISATVSALPQANASETPAPEFTPSLKHEARTTSVPVAFNAKAFKTVGFTHQDAPALFALGRFMRATYLHREIREKGGAYGSEAQVDREKGLFTFWSYRDPNIVRTYQIFESAVQEVIKGEIDPNDLKEAILNACSAIDPLESPDTKGRRRFFDDLAGFTLDMKADFKGRLLEVTEADLRRVAETYLTRDDASLATIGSPQLIEQANKEMGGVFEVAAI